MGRQTHGDAAPLHAHRDRRDKGSGAGDPVDIAGGKREDDVAWLLDAMTEAGSLEHGRRLALEYSERALALDASALGWTEESDDARFLREMIRYVIQRVK